MCFCIGIITPDIRAAIPTLLPVSNYLRKIHKKRMSLIFNTKKINLVSAYDAFLCK